MASTIHQSLAAGALECFAKDDDTFPLEQILAGNVTKHLRDLVIAGTAAKQTTALNCITALADNPDKASKVLIPGMVETIVGIIEHWGTTHARDAALGWALSTTPLFSSTTLSLYIGLYVRCLDLLWQAFIINLIIHSALDVGAVLRLARGRKCAVAVVRQLLEFDTMKHVRLRRCIARHVIDSHFEHSLLELNGIL